MQLIAKVKLHTTPEQFEALKQTLIAANECCDWLSSVAWETHKFRQFSLHKVGYHKARAAFPALNSCIIIRCEAKVSQAYAFDTKTAHTFKPLGAIEYDHNILTWYVDQRLISIWTIAGRIKLSFQAGPRQLDLLHGKIGQADLSLINGELYLSAPCQVEDPQPQDFHDVLGCDLGIVNLLTDSDGETFSGEAVETQRRKFAHRRRDLQRKGTKTSKRKLRQISGKQARYQTYVNHSISKHVVQKAQGTGRAIALEELGGIRDRVTVRRKQRARRANWEFYQLRQFIDYKAQRAGVTVIVVDPHNLQPRVVDKSDSSTLVL